jgi:hypothetical protein
MRNLLLADLLLGLNDLLDHRITTLRSSATGRLYEPLLVSQRDAIQALPEPLRAGEPLAEDLGAMDVRHDSFGSAVYFITEAYLRLEAYEPAFASRARAIRDAFVPSLAELRAAYPTEAAAAIRRAPKLEAMKAELEAFPVLGGSLYSWVKEYVEAGKRLDQLTSERASVRAETASDRGPAGALRGAMIGLLGRARAAMADELAANTTLPRNLVEQTFGYFDELSVTRARKTKPAESVGSTPVEG